MPDHPEHPGRPPAHPRRALAILHTIANNPQRTTRERMAALRAIDAIPVEPLRAPCTSHDHARRILAPLAAYLGRRDDLIDTSETRMRLGLAAFGFTQPPDPHHPDHAQEPHP